MSLADIVNVTITKESAQVARASFGIPLIASFHTHWTDRVRAYDASTALSTLVSEGFATSSPTYLAMAAILAQSPKPAQVKVGRRDQTWTQTVDLTPVATNSTVYSGKVGGQAWTFTSDSSATLAEVCTGIAAAITALSGAGVTADGSSGTKVVITASAAAAGFDVEHGSGVGVYTFADTTPNTGVSADLATLRAADAQWYGLVLDTQGAAAIEAAAAWAETDRVIFASHSSDDKQLDGASTTDVAYVLHQGNYARTAHFYHPKASSFFGAAMIGVIFPKDPGAATWKFKSPAGVSTYDISTTQKNALKAKDANYFDLAGGKYITTEGVTTSGEFVDITQSIDWLQATISEDVFAVLIANDKLSYEDASVDVIRAAIAGVMSRGISRKLLASSPAPTVSAPRVADVSDVDRGNRFLPDVTFSARLAGAIHKIDISGTVSV